MGGPYLPWVNAIALQNLGREASGGAPFKKLAAPFTRPILCGFIASREQRGFGVSRRGG